MNDIFDFRIKQSVFVQTLEAYKSMEILLEAEMEAQMENATGMQKNWSGMSSYSFNTTYHKYLNQGKYDQTYKKVVEMRELMEGALPEINALLARCEGFLDQLQSDTYVELIRPAEGDNTSRNGDILSLNYDVVGILKELSNTIEEDNLSLTNELNSIIGDCGSMLDDVGSNQSEVESASKKIKRIANYHDSFRQYETGIRNLEFEMNLKLCSMAENVEELCKEVGISETELESGVMDLEAVTALQLLSQEALTLLMNQYLEEGNVEGMRCVAEQIFVKDVRDWSDAEILFLAATLNYAFENSNLEMIEMYTGNLFTAEYSEPKTSYFDSEHGSMQYTTEFQAKPDSSKIDLIMSQMDPESQGKAYYTLNRISKLQFQPITITLADSKIVECGNCLVDTKMVDDQIIIGFTAQIPQKYGEIFSTKKTQCEFTVSNLREVITQEDAERLAEIGFTEEQVEAMRLSAVTDMDIVFLDMLANRSYVEVFDVPHWDISDYTGAYLAEYVTILELNNQIQELQNMVNGILTTDAENNSCYVDTSGAYLEMLQNNLILDIYKKNDEVLLWENGSIEEKELIADAKRAYKQYGLWSAVKDLYYLNLTDLGYKILDYYEYPYINGYSHTVISDLEDGIGGENSMFRFNFDIVDSQSGKSLLEGWHGTMDQSIVSAKNYAESIVLLDLGELKEKKKKLAINSVVKGITMLTDKVLPGSSYIIPIVNALDCGEYNNVVEAQLGFPYEDYVAFYESTEGQKLTRSEFDSILEAYFEYQELEQQIEEKEKILNSIELAQAIRIKYKFFDENGNYYVPTGADKSVLGVSLTGGGVMLPQAAKNLIQWEDEGIRVFLRARGMSENKIEDIIPFLEKEYCGEQEWDILIYGGDISSISQEMLSSHIIDIEGWITQNTDISDCDISQWLREEEVLYEKE